MERKEEEILNTSNFSRLIRGDYSDGGYSKKDAEIEQEKASIIRKEKH